MIPPDSSARPAASSDPARPVLHPLTSSRPLALARSLLTHGGFAPRYSWQVALMIASALVRSPVCMIETLRVASRVAKVSFDPAPVIIIGHWRSGTTYLHNLMSRDDAFCFPTIMDAMRPFDFYPGPIEALSRAIMLRLIPAKRPMDDIPMQPDLPQEDELALGTMGAPSFLNCFYFPRTMHKIFLREVLFDSAAPDLVARWQGSLRLYLAKLAALHRGQRLLLKNPAHSARLPRLRVLFPGAKFIHIHRDPLDVVQSTRKLYRSVLPLLALQSYDLDAVEGHIIDFYEKLMDRLFAGLADLPADNVAEVRYADLTRDPLAALQALYDRLGLHDFEHTRAAISDFLQANRHAAMAPAERDRAFAQAHAERLAPYRKRLGY
jgi:hypothetical protein